MRIQKRGNCQCCGRDQAVLKSGLMSKHGYTVDHGWFNGVCSGEYYKPLQEDRSKTDAVIEEVRNDVAKLLLKVDNYENGNDHPEYIEHYTREKVSWEEASDYDRKNTIRLVTYRMRYRARSGEDFANYLEALANEVHGSPLREVKIDDEPPAPVRIGEKRKAKNGSVLTATRVEGQRVHWTSEKGSRSWTGKTAWKKLELA